MNVSEGTSWLRHGEAEGVAVDVQFTAGGTVLSAAGRGRPQHGPLSRLRAWLGW
jgi:hypothetical protein